MNSNCLKISQLINVRPRKMNPEILNEVKVLLTILGQCVSSFQADFANLDCKSPSATTLLLSSVIFKLQKIVECAKSIQRICKSLNRDDVKCLPCLTSVDENHSK